MLLIAAPECLGNSSENFGGDGFGRATVAGGMFVTSNNIIAGGSNKVFLIGNAGIALECKK
jgi:hypothetical protein